jgi:glycosyltransferase involved in cell wall biosynthesis
MAITGAFTTDGGIAAVNRLIIRALGEEGYFLDIFALTEEKADLDPRYISATQVNLKVFNQNKLTFTIAVWQALVATSYAFILADLVNIASILVPPSKLLRKPYIVWLYGVDVFPPRPDWEGRLGLKNARRRLAISKYTHDIVNKQFPELPIDICELALDPVRHLATLPTQPIESYTEIELKAIDGSKQRLGSRVILHVGRMVSGERYKGQDTLLKAFPAIHTKFPQAQLVMVGQGDDLEQLRHLAQTLTTQQQAQIFLPGYLDSELLLAIYNNCYLFAMPSKGEGFGLVYLEAMSRAKPCIGGNVDATPYVIKDKVTGLLADDPTSAQEVADKIICLLENPSQAQAMGRAGYDLVRSNYLFSHFKERFWYNISH